MEQQRKPKKPNPAWLLALLLPIMLIYSANRFINTADSYRQYTITGREVIERLPHFWLFVVLGIIGCLVFLILAYINETGIWFGKHMRGSMAANFVFILLALACLITPWIRAMAIKANGGVDLPKTQIQPYETRTTYCSTAWNTCNYPAHGLPVKG